MSMNELIHGVGLVSEINSLFLLRVSCYAFSLVPICVGTSIRFTGMEYWMTFSHFFETHYNIIFLRRPK